MAKMTRDNQVKEVVQGLALGVLHAGVAETTSSKIDLEFAIGRALRPWPGAAKYPSLQDFIQGPNYIYLGFGKSARRNGVVYAAWERQQQGLAPYLTMPHFTVAESLDMFAEYSAVTSVSAWTSLGAAFTAELEIVGTRRASGPASQ